VGAIAHRALDQRLERGSATPIVVAFSGGGDSLALLLEAKRWADRAGRRLVAMTVDHGLQPAGAEWALWCRRRAEREGVPHQTLVWRGVKPAKGLPAAARLARHRLIANAARDLGARIILLGHTADDSLEATIMSEDAVRISAPRPWSPSPVWPEGRGLFILRPLLAARRSAIRSVLECAGQRWIDDPVNLDQRHPRARARLIAAGRTPDDRSPDRPDLAALLGASRIGPAGQIELPVKSLSDGSREACRAYLGAALLCVAGREAPARGSQIDRLMTRIAGPDAFACTLAGARVAKSADRLTLVREIGDTRRYGRPVAYPQLGEIAVWDGRFEVQASEAGLAVAPLAGLAARLSSLQREGLRALDPAARLSVPVVVDAQGKVSCPLTTPDPRITLRSLVAERLAAASGAVQSEAAIWRVAKSAAAS